MTDYNDIYEGNYSEDDFDDFCGSEVVHDYRIVFSSGGVNYLYCSRCGAESEEYRD